LRISDPTIAWVSANQAVIERAQVEADPRYASVRESLLAFLNEYSLELLIPLTLNSKLISILGLGKKETLQAYHLSDIELLGKLGRQIGISIDNAIHHEDIVEKERLDEELKLGREIQVNLLPHDMPDVSGLKIHGVMQPAKEIGGDYYDFVNVPNKEDIAIVIGDVSGKGVGAGLIMSMMKATIHTLSHEGFSPKEILLRSNEFLNQHVGEQKFMTLLYLLWRSQERMIIYSSAGHEHILIYRVATGVVEAIVSGGFMLGMLPDIEAYLEEKRIKLDPGDKILLYTDGVTEAENKIKDRFGLDRLKEAFLKHSSKPAAELMKSVKDEVYDFIGEHPQYDDITLVVLEAQ
jgi:phosphoserine phosphatase RsbU/P